MRNGAMIFLFIFVVQSDAQKLLVDEFSPTFKALPLHADLHNTTLGKLPVPSRSQGHLNPLHSLHTSAQIQSPYHQPLRAQSRRYPALDGSSPSQPDRHPPLHDEALGSSSRRYALASLGVALRAAAVGLLPRPTFAREAEVPVINGKNFAKEEKLIWSYEGFAEKPSGVLFKDVTRGNGILAKTGDRCVIECTGYSIIPRPATAATEAATPGVYEARVPTEALGGFLATTGVLGAAGTLWWNEVIPQKRNELAKSKASGDVKELLDDIKNATDEDMRLERWFFTDWIKRERKPAAIPFLKKAKWNSGDNPVLVAFGGIMSLVAVAAIGERGSGAIDGVSRPFETKLAMELSKSNEKDDLRFELGKGSVIPAIEDSVRGMSEGSVRQLVMQPAALASFSGLSALDSMLKNEDLVDKRLMFNVKLVRVDQPGQNGYNLAEGSQNVSALELQGSHLEYFIPGLFALAFFVLSLVGFMNFRTSYRPMQGLRKRLTVV